MAKHNPFGTGDIILVDAGPVPEGVHEQSGKRPWLVLSDPALCANTGFVWAVPFTTTDRDYPLTLKWRSDEQGTKTHGTLLVHQLATVDVRNRDSRFLEHAGNIPPEVYDYISAILAKK